MYLLLAGLIGYFCGAIPFGYLFVKATKGINILDYGSGRTGGTNSYRAAGLGTGIITALSDVLKGFAIGLHGLPDADKPLHPLWWNETVGWRGIAGRPVEAVDQGLLQPLGFLDGQDEEVNSGTGEEQHGRERQQAPFS